MMNKALAQRVKELMDYKRLKSVELARMLGVTTTTLNNWRSGNTAISHENIRKIVELFDDVSYEWLADGRGQMIRSAVNRKYCVACTRKEAQIELLEKQVEYLSNKIDLLNKQLGGLER